MKCQKCRESIPQGQIDTTRGVATCSACGQMQLAVSDEERATQRARLDSEALPRGMTLEKRDDGLTITFRDKPRLLPLLTFVLVAYVIYENDLIRPAEMLQPSTTLLALMLIAHLYLVLGTLFNKNSITVDRQFMTKKSGPFPKSLTQITPVQEVAQVFVKEHVQRWQMSHLATPTHSYTANVVTKNGKQRPITPKMVDAGVCLQLELEIERFLGIEDEFVPGQVSY